MIDISKYIFFILLSAFPVASDTLAKEADVYPSEIRVITQTNETSECIGDPRTPVCAVETLLACFIRQQRSLCETVTRRKIMFSDQHDEKTEYRILSMRISIDHNATQEPLAPVKMQREYADVEIEDQTVWKDRYNYCLQSTPTGWEILDWAIEGGDMYCN